MTYQTDEKDLNNLREYLVGVIKLRENVRIPTTHIPSNFLTAAPTNFNQEYLACHCHISNFESDFFLRERDFINPSPMRRPIAKNQA